MKCRKSPTYFLPTLPQPGEHQGAPGLPTASGLLQELRAAGSVEPVVRIEAVPPSAGFAGSPQPWSVPMAGVQTRSLSCAAAILAPLALNLLGVDVKECVWANEEYFQEAFLWIQETFECGPRFCCGGDQLRKDGPKQITRLGRGARQGRYPAKPPFGNYAYALERNGACLFEPTCASSVSRRPS